MIVVDVGVVVGCWLSCSSSHLSCSHDDSSFSSSHLLLLFFFLFSNFTFGQTTITIIPTGSGTFSVPCDVTSLTVEAWGGGGAGGGATANRSKGGAGGAGGTYALSVLTVTPGQIISYNVGAGANGASSAGAAG